MSDDMQNEKVIEVTTEKVSCDGGGGVLGHPLTYYVIGKAGFVQCNYCDRIYKLKK